MLRDVFYYGQKPNVHPREKPAKNLEDARHQATTEHFWIVNEYCDYTNFDWDFDFDFLDDDQVWTQDHNNVWPSQHCKDSGTWLCSKIYSDKIIYRTDVPFVKRMNIKTENWVEIEKIDSNFDFSWHPDPTDPPYIYAWGCRYYPATHKPVLEYRVSGATEYKYMEVFVELLPDFDNYKILHEIEENTFDFRWRPDVKNPPYIYVWGNQHYDAIDMPTIEYHVPGATERHYMDKVWHPRLKQRPERFQIFEKITDFDYSWVPDPNSPPYIYVWGNQWNKPEDKASVLYKIENATEYKYMNNHVTRLPDKTNWDIPSNIDIESFDFSWEPNPNDIPYIYQFGTQWQKTGGPRYIVEGATEIKYIDIIKAKALPDKTKFVIAQDIDIVDFDFSWHHDETEEPYIYVFGNQYYSAEKMPTIEYHVESATQYKYVDTVKATLGPNKTNWHTVIPIDETKWDYNWIPDPGEPAYIYVWGNQWNSAELESTVEYRVPGAVEKKYMNDKVATVLPDRTNWNILEPIHEDKFDFSWRPNPYEDPYVYTFGNNLYPAEEMPTVEYKVSTATQRKYVNDFVAQLATDMRNWELPDDLDVSDFDFSWKPHPMASPFIYQFGTQWQKTGGPRYITPGVDATSPVKYIDREIQSSKAKPAKERFTILNNYNVIDFDYSWHPDDTEPPYIYIFGNQYYDAIKMPTIEYRVEGATEFKYIDTIKVTLGPSKLHWHTIIPIDETKWDYSWLPDPDEPPYIYIWGNQWNDAVTEPTIEYKVPGATEYKYVTDIVATVLPNKSNFTVLHDVDSFDFTWRPNPNDPPYIYVFGNTQYGANKMPTILYKVKGATEKKYVDTVKAKLAQNYNNYVELLPCDKTTFDFSWVPDPDSPPYIYVFGNQWNDAVTEPTLEYRVPKATQRKYMPQTINVLPNYDNWKTIIPVENNFDFSWRPNPNDPPYIYIFGNQWNKAEVEPTLVYTVKNAKSKKYIENIVAEVSPDMSNWIINQNIDVRNFDFSWRPNPGSPPYIYQFGTLQDDNDGPRYVTPDNNGEIVRLHRVEKKIKSDENIPKYYIKTTLEDLIEDHPNELFWAIRKNINYTNFDFTWRPNIEQARYVQVFGSPEAIETQTYFVSAKMYKQGYTKFNFITSDAKIENEYLVELFEQPDMFFIDRGNIESKNRYEQLQQRFPKIQKARYHNGWVETIYRCLNKCTTQLAWILNSELDYSDFDFRYYPNPWQMKMIHIFGTQWNHWGTTYMINKDTFIEDTKYIKIIEHLSNINFVKNRIAKAMNCLYDVYLIDHGNDIETTKNQLENKIGRSVRVVPYKESYLKTFKNMLQSIKPKKEHYIWICSSICDYENFDFGYICDPFARENLHVFPSNKQKFGDTFLVDVNKMRSLINDLKQLEDFEKVNYNQHLQARRFHAPLFVVNEDTHYNSYDVNYEFPYALFLTKDNENLLFNYNEPMSLWHSKNIEILSTGGSLLAIPKKINEHVSEELYDYPNIIKAKNIIKSNPLDIVYLSNGEKTADENYEHLLKITKGLPNRVVRIDGVNGRVAAYHSVAEASNTPWMFTVFAKLKIDDKFDFSWQPDRLQIPKHYIFTAKNPINGLIYGHQAMIAYNKKLVLKNKGKGLDFTLDDPHMVVDIFSGIATFNTDAYSTWRTAFREVIKLKSDYTDISQERLRVWLSKAEGNFAEQCLQGAKDAVNYYDSVSGDIDQLKLSYEWDWLKDYYNRKYK